MFLLVASRHLGAHTVGHQHGVSIQISINLGKKYLRITRIRKIAVTRILGRVFAYYLLSFPRFWTLSIDRFWFLFWSILNCMTLKTSTWTCFQTNAFMFNFTVTNSFETFHRTKNISIVNNNVFVSVLSPSFLNGVFKQWGLLELLLVLTGKEDYSWFPL